MRRLSTAFWSRSCGAAKLAIQQQLEYRLNMIFDMMVLPVMLAGTEVALWWAICSYSSIGTVGGLTPGHYLAYALWAAFFARIYSSWMFEHKMVDDVNSGAVNSILVRPISFYEFYLGQFYGYKIMTIVFSMWIPAVICLLVPNPTDLRRLPAAIAGVVFYLLLVHTISFCVASFSFFYHRVQSFTAVKNFTLWALSGELFPLDLLPADVGYWVMRLPFANGVYMPVGYLTGRLDHQRFMESQWSTAAGILFFGALGAALWKRGLKQYAGTGA